MDSKDNLWSAASRSGLPSGDKDRDGANGDPQSTASSTGDKVAPVFVFPSSSAGGRKMCRRGSLSGLCPSGIEDEDDVSPGAADDNDNDNDNNDDTRDDQINDNVNDGGTTIYTRPLSLPQNLIPSVTHLRSFFLRLPHPLNPSVTTPLLRYLRRCVRENLPHA